MRQLRLVLVLAALACAQVARADVDLTGSWIMEGFGVVLPVTIVQAGTAISLQIDTNDPMTGTIDPATGAFSVVGVPHPGGSFPTDPPFVYGPSPPPTLSATATADGTRFAGIEVEYFIKVTPPVDFSIFPWFGLGFDVHATRAELAVCGDGDVDPGERCDDGATNGSDGCCSATCQLVNDSDNDGICDARDNCPTVYNPAQDVVCFVHPPGTTTLLRARIALPQGRVRVTGVIPGPAVDAGVENVNVAPVGPAGTLLSCTTRSAARVMCTGTNVRVRLSRIAGSTDWRFVVEWHAGGAVEAAGGPVSVDFEDAAGFHWTDDLGGCVTTPRRISCG